MLDQRMLDFLGKPGSWRYALAGAVPLTVISLGIAYDAVRERRDRTEVLAHGRDAQARVVRGAGLESVLIAWTDEGGRRLTAEGMAGKPFARTSAGATVPIRYDPALVRKPVILSQADERERVNAFWIRSSLLQIPTVAAIYVVVFLMLRARRAREGATPGRADPERQA